ncbi:30S ribosomal protein S6 [Candidatus Kaiserbacteria bacterium]|nr:30S ribosomal protein S6 [Candidatus Kaiserbacteria bacterium]
MSETKMPATEAGVETHEVELHSYELAFHVLPTVAEGEVANVFQKLKDIITKDGGVITTEEEPARFDLAYEIIKYLEGRNRKFTSAYFGWVRFQADASIIEGLNHEIDGVNELLRHLLVKLTKVEEANPFFFHEALAETMVKTVDVDEAEADESDEDEDSDDVEAEDGEEAEDKV